MSDLRNILRRAARRDLARRALRRSGIGLIAGLALGCLMLAADRLGLLAVSGLAYVLVAGLGAIAGAITAALTGPDRLALAVHLDRVYRLDDQLATAESLRRGAGRSQDDAFGSLVRREADRLAGSLDVRPALPVRIPGIWGGAAALAVLLWIGALMLPAVAPSQRAEAGTLRPSREALRAERASVADSIRDVVEDLEDEASLGETAQGELDALDALAGQLTGENAEDFDPAAARDESAARINELADRLAEQAEKNAAAVDELARRFAGIDPPEVPMSAEEFTEALRRGEFGRAADLLDKLMQKRDGMTERERQVVADHLRKLSEEIEKTAQSEDPAAGLRREGLEDALRDQGLAEEDIQRLLDSQQTGAEDVQRDLADRNVDEGVSRELAEDIKDLRKRQQTNEQANREAQGVADAVRDAADAMESPEPREPAQTSRQPAQEANGQPASDDGRRPPATPSKETEPSTPPAGAEAQRPDTERATETERPGGRSQESEQPPAGQPVAQPAEQVPSTEPRQPGQNQSADADAAEPAESERVPGQQPAGRRGDDARGDELTGPEAGGSGERTGRQPGQIPPEDTDRPDQIEPSPADLMRELERRRETAHRQQEAADRAREAASEMAENMTEEERRQWTDQWQREFGMGDSASTPALRDETAPPGNFETDTLDLSDGELSRRTIAEWLSDQPVDSTPGETETGSPSQHVRQAQRTAERAVEDAAVPARYHRFIRKYFGRLEETVDKAAAKSPAAPASDTKPAETPPAGSQSAETGSDTSARGNREP